MLSSMEHLLGIELTNSGSVVYLADHYTICSDRMSPYFHKNYDGYN